VSGAALVLILALGGQDQSLPPIGIVDLYGRRAVPEAAVRDALGLRPGDRLPETEEGVEARIQEARRRLAALPGVAATHVELVCCEAGRLLVYAGLRELGSAQPVAFASPPSADLQLAPDVVETGRALDAARRAAVLRGNVGEDHSEGHALADDPAARALQGRYVDLAARDLDLLRRVLREARDAEARALAAEVLAYARDKAAVAPDLSAAAQDPDPGVRNNALRALWVMAEAPRVWPGGRVAIPAGPLVVLVRSISWSDRNKAAALLMALSQARDAGLLARLRAEALEDLADMARWQSKGHAIPAVFILGRVAGLSEEEIARAAEAGDRERVIAAARAAAATAPGGPCPPRP
jgi:hypothetical protein